MIAHGPADDPAAVEVHDGGQIEPSLIGLDVGDIGEPDPVRRSPLPAAICLATMISGVLVESDSPEAVKTFYYSDAYQAVQPIRLNASNGFVCLLIGLD